MPSIIRQRAVFAVFCIVTQGAFVSCSGGGSSVTGSGDGNGTVTGIVVQAPVSGATVTAYQLDAKMNRGVVLGTATTADGSSTNSQVGTYTLKVAPYNGPLELVASGGIYVDESTGVQNQMAGYDISAVIAAFQSGTSVTATISPISSMAAAFARYDLKSHGTALVDAVNSAYTHLNAHFGGVDWRVVVPADLSTATTLTEATTAAMVLAGLSDEAAQISRNIQGVPGVTVTGAMLAQVIARDAENGVLDGMGDSGLLNLGTLARSYQPDGKTARFFLATAMLDYVQEHQALSGLTRQVNSLAGAISANSDPYLFNSAGLALNTQAPTVTLTAPGSGAGPYYVNSDSVTIAAAATPVGNGVAGVFAVVPSSSQPVAGTYCSTCSPAVWQMQIPLWSGQNLVKVYATDNTGQGGAAGCVAAGSGSPSNCASLTIVQDKNAPTVFASTSPPATYYDESSTTVAAVAPPVYDSGRAQLVSVGNGATIHKIATRLAPTSTTGPAVLENADSKNGNSAKDNLPWLQFVASLTGAPINTATYSITATSGSSTVTYTGDIMPWLSPQSSPTASSGLVYFDLPLDSTRIPMLTTASGAVQIAVTVTVNDVSGNSSSGSASVTYDVIGPPLNIAQDTGYPSSNTPSSTYPYKLANSTSSVYATLFDTNDFTAFGNSQRVRLVRYVITNPFSQPVALTIPALSSSSWSMSEGWTGKQSATTSSVSFNNATCPPDNACATAHSSMYLPPGASGPGSGSYCNNDPGAAAFSSNGSVSTSSLSTVALQVQNGGDTSIPALTVGGRYVVPAANGATPGVIALYVTRPVGASRAISLGEYPYVHDEGSIYTFSADADNSASTNNCCAAGYLKASYYFDYLNNVYFITNPATHTCGATPTLKEVCGPGGQFASSCSYQSGWVCGCTNSFPPSFPTCTNCTDFCSCTSWSKYQTYNIASYYQQLDSASEQWTGSFTPVTYGSDGNGQVYGLPSTGAASVAVSGNVTH